MARNKNLNLFFNLVGKNEVGKGTKGAEKDLKAFTATALKAAGALAAGYAAFELTGAYVNVNKQIQSTNNLLGLVTDNVKATSNTLAQLSQRTRGDYFTTARLYSSLAAAGKDFNIGQEKILEFTELINKSVVISGSSSEEAKNSLRQLQQAIQGGILRAEEMNSIFEGTPEIMRRLAAGMGISMGEVRKASADGLITTKVLIEAITNQADVTNEKFAGMGVTMEQAHTQAANAMALLYGRIEENIQVVGTYSNIVSFLSETLTDNILEFASLNARLEESEQKFKDESEVIQRNTARLKANTAARKDNQSQEELKELRRRNVEESKTLDWVQGRLARARKRLKLETDENRIAEHNREIENLELDEANQRARVDAIRFHIERIRSGATAGGKPEEESSDDSDDTTDTKDTKKEKFESKMAEEQKQADQLSSMRHKLYQDNLNFIKDADKKEIEQLKFKHFQELVEIDKTSLGWKEKLRLRADRKLIQEQEMANLEAQQLKNINDKKVTADLEAIQLREEAINELNEELGIYEGEAKLQKMIDDFELEREEKLRQIYLNIHDEEERAKYMIALKRWEKGEILKIENEKNKDEDSQRKQNIKNTDFAFEQLMRLNNQFGDKKKGYSKALFAFERAWAVVSIIKDTNVAAAKALAELGPIVGAPVAAGIKTHGYIDAGVTGALAIGQTFSGGGSGGGGGSYGGSSLASPRSESVVSSSELEDDDRERNITVILENDIVSSQGMRKVIEEVIEREYGGKANVNINFR